MARKYDRKASENVRRVMHERKTGQLRSGSGRKVTSRKQAIAIGLSEARREGDRVPSRSSRSSRSSARGSARSGRSSGARTRARGKRSTRSASTGRRRSGTARRKRSR